MVLPWSAITGTWGRTGPFARRAAPRHWKLSLSVGAPKNQEFRTSKDRRAERVARTGGGSIILGAVRVRLCILIRHPWGQSLVFANADLAFARALRDARE